MQKFIICIALLVSASAFSCEYSSLSFNGNFAGGRLDYCDKLDDVHYVLGFQPEHKPINSSPWYAFQIDSEQAQNISLSLDFNAYAPRYLPKLSSDGVNWVSIPATIDDNRLQIELSLSKGRVWIAGQELLTSQWYENWFALVKWPQAHVMKLGQSPGKRSIWAIENSQPKVKDWLIVIGRQHPPEVTGVFAMQHFVDRLLVENSLSNKFMQKFNILVVPDLNPDGVDAGNWRYNLANADLNRDWGKFEQAETRLVRDKLQAIIRQGGNIVFAVDFHSTHQDIFYTMPEDYGIQPATLIDNWLEQLQETTKNLFTVRTKAGTNPDSGVFKQYIADTFAANALTFELGDSTDRVLIGLVATKAAESLMQKMLETNFRKANNKHAD